MNNVLYEVVDQCLLAKDISRLILKSPKNAAIAYQAGQYITVLHADGRESPMSVACAPFDTSIIELHLHHPQENPQALDLLKIAQADKNLLLRGPDGACTVAHLPLNRPIIFVANGTGFAPIKSVMEELLLKQNLPPIHFFWYAEGLTELYLNELVVDWQSRLKHFTFSLETADKVISNVIKHYPDLSAYQVYAVEAPQEISKMLDVFMRHGLQRQYFYSDVA